MENKIVVIIPAYNEENSIAKVIHDLPAKLVTEIIVVDNNSTDNTSNKAKRAGATVLFQQLKGYGNACLTGIEYLKNMKTPPAIVVFIDGDYSDYPEQLPVVIKPIIEEDYDMVIGSRNLGLKAKGSMMPQQVLGNKLATTLMKWLYKTNYTDLGPFRAIKYKSLIALNMADKNYGWTVEMQLKAAKLKMKTCEVAVDYRKRIGVSKVSGTVKGTLGAGYKIITTIFRYI
ncbi:glycosyltransferase family 2 protein [Ferruginibacter sp.]|uniref:glycosyltransferase family 2 protein n=1 Tax=Ferruginibacter sp. TaxID=1940288 RepID=UPI001987E8C8|nr:glycosyltransferase family 2 protein [Ferruginibacter sp.]MBC7629509.1 glycosyltransferase family 2 protein [Ferruginibacter sp.]